MKRASVVLLAAALASACGKKGPPLPPLIRIPVAPAELTAVRRGDTVDVQFTVPAVNTDGTRPANVERVDVYAFTGPDIRDDELSKLEPKIASVPVKAPRDPNQTVEEDEPTEDMEPPEGAGLDQGAKASLQERLTAASLIPPDVARKGSRRILTADERPLPLLGPPPVVPSRTYVAVGFSANGRKGPMSRRAAVPLMSPPPPPAPPTITYTETAITVTWMPPAGLGQVQQPAAGQVQQPAAEEVLPATLIGVTPPALTYNVYEALREPTSASPDTGAPKPGGTRLTGSPVSDPTYTDNRIVWGAERCYDVRTVETIGGLSIESDAPPPACATLVDTFPPAAPKGLTAVPGEGAISLIWQPNDEKDLGGYLVLRGVAPDTLEPMTPSPIQETTFRDTVAAGGRYSYVVKAVDNAGNQSDPSNRADETAR